MVDFKARLRSKPSPQATQQAPPQEGQPKQKKDPQETGGANPQNANPKETGKEIHVTPAPQAQRKMLQLLAPDLRWVSGNLTVLLDGSLVFPQVKVCHRCGSTHGQTIARPLSNPEYKDLTHFFMCEHLGQPVLIHTKPMEKEG